MLKYSWKYSYHWKWFWRNEPPTKLLYHKL